MKSAAYILHEKQYKIACAWATRFRHDLINFDEAARIGVDPIIVKAERDALESQLESLRTEIYAHRRLNAALRVLELDCRSNGLPDPVPLEVRRAYPELEALFDAFDEMANDLKEVVHAPENDD